MTNTINTPLTLPSGVELPNRLVKAAMTEGLATMNGVPTPELERLYGLWSDGGAGVLISGNIQIDRWHLEQPGNVIIDGESSDELHLALQAWTRAATRGGNHFWAQISHAGRQTPRTINPAPKAPSAVPLALPGGQFGDPVELSELEIHDIIRRFGVAAGACKAAGFTGVQIHSAHGYLLSSFLSPLSNHRIDEYGGPLENRLRFPLEVLRAIRAPVGADTALVMAGGTTTNLKGAHISRILCKPL